MAQAWASPPSCVPGESATQLGSLSACLFCLPAPPLPQSLPLCLLLCPSAAPLLSLCVSVSPPTSLCPASSCLFSEASLPTSPPPSFPNLAHPGSLLCALMAPCPTAGLRGVPRPSLLGVTCFMADTEAVASGQPACACGGLCRASSGVDGQLGLTHFNLESSVPWTAYPQPGRCAGPTGLGSSDLLGPGRVQQA